MSYIGASPTSTAFVTDSFSGNASTTTFTMSVAPANTSSALVAISGVLQDPTTYSVNGTTLTFSSAPPIGTGNISIRYLGIPASGVTTTAYRTVTEFTATQNQTTFSTPSYTVGYISVYRNGIRLASGDYTASSGTSVVLNNSCAANDLVTVESLSVSSVSNAIPQTGGIINSPSGATTLQLLSNNILGLYQDANANLGIGTNSPGYKLDVQSSASSGAPLLANFQSAGGDTQVYVYNGTVRTQLTADNTYSASIVGSLSNHPLIIRTNNTERGRFDTSGNLGLGTTSPTTYKNAKLAIRNSASSGEAVLAVINNSSNVYEGAGILLGSTAASTNYGATWLYHTYNTNSPTNTTSYAFNISQRATDGTYVSNIWNVDYQNSVQSWYRPNNSALAMQLDGSNNFLFNSGYGSAAIAYGCRAWVNFNGSSGSMNGNGNVSSVTRNGTGDYTINFTNAMPDVNYAVTAWARSSTAGNFTVVTANSGTGSNASSSAKITVRDSGANLADPTVAHLAVFR